MLKLIQNEFIKIFRQSGWRITVMIILIVAAAVPPIMRSMIPEYNMPDISYSSLDYYKDEYEKAKSGTVEKEFYKSAMDIEKFYNDNNIDRTGWRRGYTYNYEREVNTLKALELIENGWDIEETAEVFQYNSDFELLYDESGELKPYIETLTDADYNNGSFSFQSVPFSVKNISEYIKNTKESISAMENLLLAGKTEFADIKIEETKTRLEEEKTTLAAAEEKYKKDGSNRLEYETSRNRCEVLELIIQCWESFKKCDGENEDWIYGEICSEMEAILNHAEYFAIKDKEIFADGKYTVAMGGNLSLSFNTYEKYVEQYAEPKREDYILAAQTVLYSIENQIPVNTDRISVKGWLDYSVNIDVYVVMFFCIFLASVIMSSEYGSGAIRLLVIRPRARWKLLLSKLLTVGIFGVCMLTVSSLVSFLSTILSFGRGDLSIPYIESFAGKITHIQPLLYTLRNAITNSLSMFCIAALAFLLSLLIKKGTFSVAVSVLIYAFGNTIANVSWYTLEYIPFLRYSIVPYFMNLGTIRYTALQRALHINSLSVDYGLTIESGIIITLLTGFTMLLLSLVIFDRQQIKN